MMMTHGQDPLADQLAEAEAAKKLAEARKAEAEANLAAFKAQKELEAAQAPPDPSKKELDDQLAEAEAAKKIADAAKAAADARKAQAEAALAALKAEIGEVPSAGYTGEVTLKDKAGATEGFLLAAKAAETAAQRIAAALPGDGNRELLLYAAGEVPNFQALIAFCAQRDLVKEALKDAKKTSGQADSEAPGPPPFKIAAVPTLAAPSLTAGAPPLAATGLTLDAVNKLLGYFRTDYSVGGLEIKFEDSLLVHALAGAIASSNKKYKGVQLPAVYSPKALSDPSSGILNGILELSKLKVDAQADADRHDKLSAYFNKEAGKATDPAQKEELLRKAKIHKDAADACKAAVGLYDGFLGKLTTADDKGAIQLAKVIYENIVADALKTGGLLLLVKLQQSGGSYYTKKNMWTLFGGMPFYHMGGVVASFVLLEGPSPGNVLKAGVVPVHGGFIKAADLQQEFVV